ncbi:MAG: hypothetical protein MSD82_12400 [Prevotella sp.]|nr:hypothetical protein [Prevotella sp.]
MTVITLMTCSCRTKYVTVPEYHKEYITKLRVNSFRDSIYHHDSIMIRMQGDTVYADRYHTVYRDRLRDRLRIDTLLRTDSVRVPYPVERELSKWQKVQMDAGKIGLGIIAIGMLYIIIYVVRRRF